MKTEDRIPGVDRFSLYKGLEGTWDTLNIEFLKIVKLKVYDLVEELLGI